MELNRTVQNVVTTIEMKIAIAKNNKGSEAQTNTNLIREYKASLQFLADYVKDHIGPENLTYLTIKSYERSISFDMNVLEKRDLIEMIYTRLNNMLEEL